MKNSEKARRSWVGVLAVILALSSIGTVLWADNMPYRLFPTLFRKASLSHMPQTVERQPQPGQRLFSSDRIPLLANNSVIAFYGHPFSKQMGVLGLYSKEEIARRVKEYARRYDAVNGPDGVVPAYYIIYGTCWPKGEIGYLDDAVLEDYIKYAQSQGMIVFVDHQIGKYSVRESMEKILPFLRYPNVHLAIDPEWRTLNPMKEIGSITAAELNEAQKIMQDYIIEHKIPGIRMLVVHQFHEKMITDRQEVKANFDRVLLVHTADGFGSPALKRNTYAMNSRADNMPVKGFKLFFKSDFPLAGYDIPLLSPEEVMALEPRPSLIIYQ